MSFVCSDSCENCITREKVLVKGLGKSPFSEYLRFQRAMFLNFQCVKCVELVEPCSMLNKLMEEKAGSSMPAAWREFLWFRILMPVHIQSWPALGKVRKWKAEIQDTPLGLTGIDMPDLCKAHGSRQPASIISSPDNLRQKDCYIVIARTTRPPEASLWPGSVACRRFMVWSWTGRHRGHLLAPPFSEDSCASDQRRLFPMWLKHHFNSSARKGAIKPCCRAHILLYILENSTRNYFTVWLCNTLYNTGIMLYTTFITKHRL